MPKTRLKSINLFFVKNDMPFLKRFILKRSKIAMYPNDPKIIWYGRSIILFGLLKKGTVIVQNNREVIECIKKLIE